METSRLSPVFQFLKLIPALLELLAEHLRQGGVFHGGYWVEVVRSASASELKGVKRLTTIQVMSSYCSARPVNSSSFLIMVASVTAGRSRTCLSCRAASNRASPKTSPTRLRASVMPSV